MVHAASPWFTPPVGCLWVAQGLSNRPDPSHPDRGRRRFYTIGRYGRITLHQARDAAMEQVHRGRIPPATTGRRRITRPWPTATSKSMPRSRIRPAVPSEPARCGIAASCPSMANGRSPTSNERAGRPAAGLGVNVDRYSFVVEDSHLLHSAGFYRRSLPGTTESSPACSSASSHRRVSRFRRRLRYLELESFRILSVARCLPGIKNRPSIRHLSRPELPCPRSETLRFQHPFLRPETHQALSSLEPTQQYLR